MHVRCVHVGCVGVCEGRHGRWAAAVWRPQYKLHKLYLLKGRVRRQDHFERHNEKVCIAREPGRNCNWCQFRIFFHGKKYGNDCTLASMPHKVWDIFTIVHEKLMKIMKAAQYLYCSFVLSLANTNILFFSPLQPPNPTLHYEASALIKISQKTTLGQRRRKGTKVSLEEQDPGLWRFWQRPDAAVSGTTGANHFRNTWHNTRRKAGMSEPMGANYLMSKYDLQI